MLDDACLICLETCTFTIMLPCLSTCCMSPPVLGLSASAFIARRFEYLAARPASASELWGKRYRSALGARRTQRLSCAPSWLLSTTFHNYSFSMPGWWGCLGWRCPDEKNRCHGSGPCPISLVCGCLDRLGPAVCCPRVGDCSVITDTTAIHPDTGRS